MIIKELCREEIQNALDLVWIVFQEFQAPDYTEQGVDEFRRFISFDSIIEQFDKGEFSFWGFFAENTLIGVIATRGTNHIAMLFVKKDYHKQGIAKRLFYKVENTCRSIKHIKKITVNSSPFAKDVYHRLGFNETDQEQTVNGITFTPMTYIL